MTRAKQRVKLEMAKYSSVDVLTEDGTDEDVDRLHVIASHLAALGDEGKPESESWQDHAMRQNEDAHRLTNNLRHLIPCVTIPAGDTSALYMVSRVNEYWTEFEYVYGDAMSPFGTTVAVPRAAADEMLRRERALQELFGGAIPSA
jgi:hypothetical protein